MRLLAGGGGHLLIFMRCRDHLLTLRRRGHWLALRARVTGGGLYTGTAAGVVLETVKSKWRCALFDIQVANEVGAAAQLLI